MLGDPGDHFIQIVFSRDGSHIATASYDRTARLVDAKTGICCGISRAIRTGCGRWLSRLMDADSSPFVRPHSAHMGYRDRQATPSSNGHDEVISGVGLLARWNPVVTGSYDKTVRIWNAATGREVKRFPGHTDRVTSAEFSPEGLRVLTASGDKSARIWESHQEGSWFSSAAILSYWRRPRSHPMEKRHHCRL